MSIEEKITLLSEVLDETELSPTTVLSELDSWDSMAKISLVSLFDDEFDKKITSADIKNLVTVADILELMP